MVTGPRGRRRAGRRSESGHGLLIVLVALLLLGAVLTLLATYLASRSTRVQERARETAVLAIADAAVAESLAQLAGRPSGAGVPPRPFGGGSMESAVRVGAGGRFTIEARAEYRGRSMAVEVEGRLVDESPRVTSWREVPDGAGGRSGGFNPAGGE